MLEMIRRLGVERRWVYGLLLGLVTVTFVGTMGWMGMSGPGKAYVAKVGGEVVLVSEFEQAYKNAYRGYQRQLGDQFSDDLMQAIHLKEQVVMALVDRKLWLATAHDLGLAASDAEVRNALLDIPAFQDNGRFNSRTYLDLLARMHTSPETFESNIREDILVDKAQQIVSSAAQVTPTDLAAAAAEDKAKAAPDQAPPTDEVLRSEALGRKRSQVVAAYTGYLRTQSRVHVYRENLGL
jgi:hypothetical protein